MLARNMVQRSFGLTAIALAITGCAATSDNSSTPYFDRVEESIERIERQDAASRGAEREQVERVDRFYADSSAHIRGEEEWLASVPFTMMVAEGQDLSLRQIMQVFARNGVNITNALDIQRYYYTGASLVDTNAKAALRVILGNMGLDYTVDSESKVVTINSMPRKAYYLSLNNRSATYSSGSPGEIDSEEGGGADSTDLGITANNDFWVSLEDELDARCRILVPEYDDPIFHESSSYMPDDLLVDSLQGGGMDTYSYMDQGRVTRGEIDEIEEEYVCLTSINRNTGTVTVHGPRWVQDDMEEYFDRLNMTLNTRITIDAKIIMFATSMEESKGLDLSLFSGSLENSGIAISNNVLGGVTLGATGNRAVISSTNSLADAFIGGRIDGAQLFLGWLESQGRVSIENEPTITTVSGVPTTFKRTSPVIYFRYNQETTMSDGGATAVSITTEEVERTVGSILNVNPTYDIDRNVVRAQMSVDQRYLTGFAEDVSILAAGNDIVEVPVRVPLIESIVLNGEMLLRDGETIIVGGQRFTTAEDASSGITNLRENRFFGGLFGRGEARNEVMTYYTVMTVHVDETPNERMVRL